MRMHHPRRALLLTFAAAAFLAAITVRGGADEAPPPAAPAAPAESAAPEALPACADCHDTEANAFPRNPHHVLGAGQAACVSCHGDVKAHLESGGEQSVERPMNQASDTAVCQSCHGKRTSDRSSFHVGIHANAAGVSCLSCHSIHAGVRSDSHLLAKDSLALCASCHESQAASFAGKPFAHRLGKSGMSCVSCHNPHSTAIRTGVLRAGSDEIACLSCHTEKKGPFVFEHGEGSFTDCMRCHQPHGSTNPRMLTRSRVDQLCLECHSPISPGTLGSQPPSFHNLLLPRYRNCTVCHAAIHGSQVSPTLLK